jgi:hypothetical protein
MLKGWRANHKHHPHRAKAVGLLDCDAADKRREWNETQGNTASAKAFCYPKPQHAIVALAAGFRLEVTLEMLYDAEVWRWADGQGLLEDRPLLETYPRQLIERILRGDAADAQIDPGIEIFVRRRFSDGTKIRAAHYVARLPDDRLRAMFERLAGTIGTALEFLGLVELQQAA